MQEVRASLRSGPKRSHVFKKHLADLVVLLHSHFARAEQDRYCWEDFETPPRLSSRVDTLQCEHDLLLNQLDRLDHRHATANSLTADDEPHCREFCDFLDAFHDHEIRGNMLVLQAYLMDIGTAKQTVLDGRNANPKPE